MAIASPARPPTRIYRDSEGRTRREQLSSTGDVQSVSISDPVAGSTYVLNPADRTAQRNHAFVALPTAAHRARTRQCDLARERRTLASSLSTPDESGEAARKREVETQAAVAAGRSGWRRGGGSGSGTGSGGGAYAGTLVYPADAVSLPRTVAPDGFGADGTET